MKDLSHVDLLFEPPISSESLFEKRLQDLLLLSGADTMLYIKILEKELINQESAQPVYRWKKEDIPYLYSELISTLVSERALERTEKGLIAAAKSIAESENEIHLRFRGSEIPLTRLLNEHPEIYMKLPLPLKEGFSKITSDWQQRLYHKDEPIQRLCNYLSGKRVNNVTINTNSLTNYLRNNENKSHGFLSFLNRFSRRHHTKLETTIVNGLNKFSVHNGDGLYSVTQKDYEIDVSLNNESKTILDGLVICDGTPIVINPILDQKPKLPSLEEIAHKLYAGKVVSQHLMNNQTPAKLESAEPEMIIVAYSNEKPFELSEKHPYHANFVKLPITSDTPSN